MDQIIELSGYEVKIPNSVYFGKKLIKPVNKRDLNFMPIIVLSRYIEPSEDDVVNAAQVKALEFLEDSYKQPANYLEEIVKSFPNYVLRNLVEEEKDYLNFIRKHTPALKLESGAESKKILKIAYAFGPPSILRLKLNEADMLKRLTSYGRKTGINLWGFDVLLTLRDCALPPKALIDVLITDRNIVSDSLRVRLPYMSCYNEIAPVLNSVYEGLPSEDEIQLIKDVTQDKLEEDLIDALEDLKETVDEGEERVEECIKKAVNNIIFKEQKRFDKSGSLWGIN